MQLASLISQVETESRSGRSVPLLLDHGLTGWPKALGGRADDAWRLLASLPTRHEWLRAVFGDDHNYRSNLIGYMWRLSFFELAHVVHSGELDAHVQTPENIILDIPPVWFVESRAVRRDGFARAFPDPMSVQTLGSQSRVDAGKMRAAWPSWVALVMDQAVRHNSDHYIIREDEGLPQLPF